MALSASMLAGLAEALGPPPSVRRVMRPRFLAPSSGRTRGTRAAAYREEAKARFRDQACFDGCLDGDGPCRFHDPERWDRFAGGLSPNGYLVARYASLLAHRDGYRIPRPPDCQRPGALTDEDIPF